MLQHGQRQTKILILQIDPSAAVVALQHSFESLHAVQSIGERRIVYGSGWVRNAAIEALIELFMRIVVAFAVSARQVREFTRASEQ